MRRRKRAKKKKKIGGKHGRKEKKDDPGVRETMGTNLLLHGESIGIAVIALSTTKLHCAIDPRKSGSQLVALISSTNCRTANNACLMNDYN